MARPATGARGRSESRQMTGYRFIAKDPIIDVFRAARNATGRSFEEIAEGSGVSVGTLRNWDYGTTRRPQHMTMRYAMSAMGYEEQWVNREGLALDVTYPADLKAPISDEEG